MKNKQTTAWRTNKYFSRRRWHPASFYRSTRFHKWSTIFSNS